MATRRIPGIGEYLLNNSGIIVGYTSVLDTASPYAVLATDYLIAADTTTTPAALTINLPTIAAAGDNRIIIVTDVGGGAAANNIDVTPAAGEEIDGGGAAVAVAIAANYGTLRLINNGVEWSTF